MEPTEPLPQDAPQTSPPITGELIVLNGRQEGARRGLNAPLTLIGRAPGCHIRLSVKSVSPLHCALIQGPEGVLVRDLGSAGGTLVNGDPVATRWLHHGDELEVGPFQFQVQLPLAGQPGSDPERGMVLPLAAGFDPNAVLREKDALRIQAAAVAAQQAALTEEEARLVQRRVALEQQEKQLAAHLEEKQRQIQDLHQQTRQARHELREQRKNYQLEIVAATKDLARERQDLAEAQNQTQAERKRVVGLWRRLKQRWHRHWMAERKAQRRNEDELAARRRDHEKDSERFQQDKEDQTRARLRFNGEIELSRRQLQSAWEDQLQAERQWEARRAREMADCKEWERELDLREARLTNAGEEMEEEKRQWQGTRLHLQKEAEGLENRIRNHRRKILGQEQEIVRLETVLRARNAALEGKGPKTATPLLLQKDESAPAPGALGLLPYLPNLPTASCPPEDQRALVVHRANLNGAEKDFQEKLAALENLAGELADQRLHVTEQWERLLQLQQRWQEEHGNAAAELEAVALHLQEQERSVIVRKHTLSLEECNARQRLNEVIHLRHHLEGCQARLRTRVVAWESERDRLLADLHGREELAQRRLQMIATIRGRWEKRRQQELTRLQAGLEVAEKLRQELGALREEWARRKENLDQRERDLAERALALEQYQQERIGQSPDSPAAEKRLECLRRRWTMLAGAVQKTIARERQALGEELARLNDGYGHICKQARETSTQDAKLAAWQTAWEHEQAKMQDHADQLQQRTESLQAQGQRYHQELEDLRDEVERVARLLLDEDDQAMTPVIVQAA